MTPFSGPILRRKEVRCQTINSRNQGELAFCIIERWARENSGSGLASTSFLRKQSNIMRILGTLESGSQTEMRGKNLHLYSKWPF